ncbi:PPC domain-containing DNA-binding protein [Streptomyces sp. SBT349]|uniref:PPC domain-containing DNA-binding protein n=1 Tax=Streptomyces sp. SBT349 TaxID=1580539 RepID=UPI00066AF259|nr:PPC domain-containing DNA-binding protein [Streptomyces sp. SBT349]
MRATQVVKGREFVVAFDEGEDFFPALGQFCAEHGIRSGYIPVLLGGFRSARLVGTCGPLENPDAPLWDSVQVEFLEACGSGTLAWDPDNDSVAPHIHLSAGLKGDQAHGRTSHLLKGTVQFINELVVVEIVKPNLIRPRRTDLYNVPLLAFDED